MLQKKGKPLSIFLGTLLFVAIAGGIWYFASNHSRKNAEPVKIYRTTETKRNGTSEITSPLSSVNGRTSNSSTHQEDGKTIDPLIVSESISTSSEDAPSDNTNPSTTSGELTQQNSESDISEPRDEELEKEKIAEIAELRVKQRRMKESLKEVQNSLRNFEERHNSRLYGLVKKLNSLSAEEQRAYFEERLDEAPDAKEFISTTFFEKIKSEAASLGYSEQAEELLNHIEKTILEKTDEEMVDEHIKELLQYGFEPKF